MHSQISVHAKALLESDVLGTKFQGEIVEVESDSSNGWMKLANEPGWVCFDLSLDMESDPAAKNEERKRALLQRAKASHRWVTSRNADVGDTCMADARKALCAALEACDDVDFRPEILERAVIWAQACSIEDELVYTAESKLQTLQSESELGRYVRVMRQN